MSAKVNTPPAPVDDNAPPFELEHLQWSNDGTVARTDDLETARAAERQFMGKGMCIVHAEELGHGVYKVVYAEVYYGSFVWGTQTNWEQEFCLYYFGSFDNRLAFVVLDEVSYKHFTGPYEEAEVIHRAGPRDPSAMADSEWLSIAG